MTVATTKESVTEMADTAPSGRPAPSSAGRRSAETDGSARKPTTSPVTVMPSWAPESMKESRSRTVTARAARLSPAAASRKSVRRSADT
ncbi:hypothetical protein SMICM17S_04754 [Streptomyces microflavus]